jgi:hypothetical protein
MTGLTEMEQGTTMSERRTGRRHLLRFFLLTVAILGTTGIVAVYSLHLNYPPIRSDGLGYYLYLPAAFIYHDLGLRSIADFFHGNSLPGMADTYLWRDSGPLLWEETGNYLIKYPMGTAILMMPFFLIACLLALATGTPLDGFSPVFQYAAAFSGLFYALAGIAVLWKVLERHFRQETILLAMVGMVFGTDLFHYATYDSVFSHVYSFFLFSAFLYVVPRLYADGALRYFLLGGALAGLIVITRPPNGLWLLFGFLYGVTSRQSMMERLAFLREHTGKMVLAALIAAGVVSLQLIYWQLVTGHPVIFSYQGERFYFASPEILNVLFSVRKGLFFWAPILLTVIPGLFYIRRKAWEYLVPILLFLPLNVYVISAWHSWFYGGSFGHRAFIESIPLFALCFCAFYEGLTTVSRKRALVCLTFVCVALETWLMVKYWTGVIPYDGTTWEYFVRTFFVLSPR